MSSLSVFSTLHHITLFPVLPKLPRNHHMSFAPFQRSGEILRMFPALRCGSWIENDIHMSACGKAGPSSLEKKKIFLDDTMLRDPSSTSTCISRLGFRSSKGLEVITWRPNHLRSTLWLFAAEWHGLGVYILRFAAGKCVSSQLYISFKTSK
jgi:hypothetical protein